MNRPTLTEIFRLQNPFSAAELSDEEILEYVEHHSGGLIVLGAPSERGYAKMHDSWGPGAPDEPGNIVVHDYDPDRVYDGPEGSISFTEDGIPGEIWPDGTVWYFGSGRDAYQHFLKTIGDD
jgi:hypothetical protein